MKVKLFSAADLLRQSSPRKFGSNRFSSLRDDSPAPQASDNGRRFRSPSVKRKPEEGASYSSVVSGGSSQVTDSSTHTHTMEQIECNTAKVNSLCEKVQTGLINTGAEPAICALFTDLCEAIKCINESQRMLADAKIGKKAPQEIFLQAPAKKVKQNIGPSNYSSDGKAPILVNITPPAPEVTETKEEADRRRFKDAVKDAERSTLLFNLNMGRVPIMNRETISKKATLALTSMAAKEEGKSTSTPSDEAVTAIDDTLSMTTGMTLFGNTTKTYVNPKDKESGSFCTIPVKYEFKDKDTRIRAEAILRSRCKVSCSTPYPQYLRVCIKQVVDRVKQKFPGESVRVNVDTGRLSLSVARRSDKESEWNYLRDPVPLPPEVLNISARFVPKDFVLGNLPSALCDFTPTKPERGRQGKIPSVMEVENHNE